LTVSLPESARSLRIPVIALRFSGEPIVEDLPIKPDSSGTLTLKAGDANIQGSAHYETSKDCIGYWTDAATTVEWDIAIERDGAYEVSVSIACEEASQGSTVSFEVGRTKLTHRVAGTGSWSDFKAVKLGQVELGKGRHKIRVVPMTKPGLAVMNLRSLTLRPID
jgi:hypothetical protein